jgi:hypothetical protein
METKSVNGITLYFDAAELEAAVLFADACAKSVYLIQNSWGLEVPKNCRLYVMTSSVKFVFRSASWPLKIIYALALPLWYSRVQRRWRFIGGWTLWYRHRPTVGVKPPALFDLADKAIGQRIYLKDDNLNRKVQSTVCHELVHAFSAHLQLPLWLNEGMAMLTSDRFVGNPTVRTDTTEFLERYPYKTRLLNYRDLANADLDSIVYNYVRGYWLTRYLEDIHPGTIRSLLANRQSAKKIEQQVCDKMGIHPKKLWKDIDQLLANYFNNRNRTLN